MTKKSEYTSFGREREDSCHIGTLPFKAPARDARYALREAHTLRGVAPGGRVALLLCSRGADPEGVPPRMREEEVGADMMGLLRRAAEGELEEL